MDTMEQNFSLICRKFTKFLNSELKNAGITPAELSYLSYLLEQNGMTQDELAKASCVDKAAVTRVIQTLEKKGVVERRADETDKRANRIYLTAKAYHYADVRKEVRQKWLRIIDVQMSQQEMQQLEQHVEEIAEKVKKAVP